MIDIFFQRGPYYSKNRILLKKKIADRLSNGIRRPMKFPT